jgi:hypothetical protein
VTKVTAKKGAEQAGVGRENKCESAFPFERDERFEAMLAMRAESKIKFEMNFSFNDKRAAEKYAEAKARHERR